MRRVLTVMVVAAGLAVGSLQGQTRNASDTSVTGRDAAADSLFAAAFSFIARGEYDDAIRIAERLLRGAGFAPAAGLQVDALLESGAYDRAERVGRELVRGAPDDPYRLTALGTALMRRGKSQEAEDVFERAAPRSLLAELRLNELRFQRGAVDSAMAGFDRFIDIYNGRRSFTSQELTIIATAASYLGGLNPDLYRDAIRVFGQAVQLDADNIEARIRQGELLLQKYNNTEASEVFREALALNPNQAGALLGLARSRRFDGAPDAMELARKSIEANESYVPARVFLARMLLEAEEYDRARDEIAKALEVNPNDPEALAVAAAERYLVGDRPGFDAAERVLLDRNPRYAELYNILADAAARNRLYPDAARFAARAVELDSLSWSGYHLLGVNQLRIGQIAEGTASLERAFAGDPFNPWVKNTLDLMDTFADYERVTTDRFDIRLHKTEAELLAPYYIEVAEAAYARMANRYGAEPPTPILLEVYPRHADFSVRTVGLAGMSARGVSFGSVLATVSPAEERLGRFNWGSTLWHEIAHAFHSAISERRVPRWFTEGLATYEERLARDAWGDDVSIGFLLAYRDEMLLPVSEINYGFINPSYPEHVVHSYYQASLVCELIEQEWGTGALVDILKGFARGKSTPDLIHDVLGMAPVEFDRRFDDYMKERFTGALVALASASYDDPAPASRRPVTQAERNPNDFMAQMTAGQTQLQDGALDEALPFFERARDLFPAYGGGDSPYWFIASIHEQQGRPILAIAALTAMTAINADHYRAHITLGRLRAERGDAPGAADALERAMFIYPYEIPVHEQLASLYAETSQWERATRERRAIIALHPVDMAEARYQLARALLEAGHLPEARSEVLRALEQAPNFTKAQDLLMEIRIRPPTSSREAA